MRVGRIARIGLIYGIDLCEGGEKGEGWQGEGKGMYAHLYSVDGVDVFHAVENDAADLLQGLVGAHDTDGATLHKHVTLRQQFDGLQHT